MANSQVGRQLLTTRPPLFAHLTVRGGTWKESDATKSSQETNGDEETFNVTGYDAGEDVSFEAFPDAGYSVAVLDVLTEQWNPANGTQPGGWTPRSWVVTKCDRSQFGKRALLFAISAIRRNALDTTQVS